MAAVKTATIFLTLGLVMVLGGLGQPAQAHHSDPPINFPRLSLYHVDCCFTAAEAADIAQFDLVILTMEAQEYNPDGIALLRQLNPDIVILPYVPSQGVDLNSPSNIRKTFINRLQDDWYLTHPNGTVISRYSGEKDLNITRADVRKALARFVARDVNSATCGGVRCWDGVFYDVVEDNITYLGQLDLDGNGVADTEVNTKWVRGYRKLFKRTRKQLGHNKTIVINGVSNLKMNRYVNGRMFEHFPTPWHADGSWSGVVENTPTVERVNSNPISIIYSAQGKQSDYQRLRYSLASSLIAGTHSGYDNGVDQHNSVWLYDEYTAVLGAATAAAVNVLNSAASFGEPGVWRRNFSGGIAVVNSTTQPHTIQFEQGFERISGTQDRTVNSGELTGSVTLAPNDGIILQRRLTQISNAAYTNGAFASVFAATGTSKRVSFFPYNERFAGGNTIVELPDVNTTVVADDTYVSVYRGATRTAHFAPYGESFQGGVNIAVDRLGGKESGYTIVTGTKQYGPQVRLFRLSGAVHHPGCFPYASDFRGGVNVAIGNVDRSNPGKEIIVAAAQGGGPHIRILNNQCQLISPGFFAYDQSLHTGVSVAAGDINNDGIDEIVTIPGPGGEPFVRAFSSTGTTVIGGFYGYARSNTAGGSVAVTDFGGNRGLEIVVMSLGVFNGL